MSAGRDKLVLDDAATGSDYSLDTYRPFVNQDRPSEFAGEGGRNAGSLGEYLNRNWLIQAVELF